LYEDGMLVSAGQRQPSAAVKSDRKVNSPEPKVGIGRNDACPCGSGKKYKRCCGSKVQQYA
ncbi:MAG: SEC-C metal-binding domain-containing protein, partial [SAR324 cluster bacterium]|nr:SEC-C metal-binding domain-containing protein [SAR324 cluster bacterium]